MAEAGGVLLAVEEAALAHRLETSHVADEDETEDGEGKGEDHNVTSSSKRTAGRTGTSNQREPWA